jgi:hypothetical protein
VSAKTLKRLERAAMAWYNSDYVGSGFPSGLRLLTASSAWNPPPPYLRLARACATHDKAQRKGAKRNKK